MTMAWHNAHLVAVKLVEDAGGTLVGRTRLQKVAYLTQLAGFGDELNFEYRHYGPFSEELATGMEIATGLGFVEEDERRADWGGKYSIYRSTRSTSTAAVKPTRVGFITAAAGIDALELELAATAAFLYAEEGIGRSCAGDPWLETAKRKPEKAAGGRLERARKAYTRLRDIPAPRALPAI